MTSGRRSRELKRQMGTNGSSAANIPPDIEWDDSNPPVIYECSQHIQHMPECDGTCEVSPTTKLKVELMNEGRAWARAGMSFRGTVHAYAGLLPVDGPAIELWDLEMKYAIMEEAFLELAGISRDEWNETFRQHKLNLMREIREQNEAAVRHHRAKQQLGIPNSPGILGPDGKPF